jgi:predicted GNAT superfamily acetyltransferase
VIRACKGFAELQACVDLEIEVWGYCEGDVIPRRMFLVAQKIGGQVIGAFETENRDQGSAIRDQGLETRPAAVGAETMVGFALSIPGVKAAAATESGMPESYLHSHMLAVREGYRNQKIGARMKLAQREEALSRGIRRIEWTFDPMEIKNSFLNIHKLGAVVRRYEENFYGVSSSRLQGGLQTDRLVAEWWLDSERVIAAIEDSSQVGEARKRSFPVPEIEAEIHVPAAVYAWKADDSHRYRAQQVQDANRLAFQRAFADGLTVVAFAKDAEGNGTFQLGRWREPAAGQISLAGSVAAGNPKNVFAYKQS